jgi:hypothetical protein
MTQPARYDPQTAAATVQMIADGTDPWLVLGQFLDDWRRTDREMRLELVNSLPPPVSGANARWAALIAAAVEWMCAQDGLKAPSWTGRSEYCLSEPWFLYPGWRLRAWQLFETPVAFRVRNIFGGTESLIESSDTVLEMSQRTRL